jgi:hypothetical protein
VKQIYDLFVSGGKDSVAAAVLGLEEAKNRNGRPAFTAPLLSRKVTLSDYVKKKLREIRLTDFFGGGK